MAGHGGVDSRVCVCVWCGRARQPCPAGGVALGSSWGSRAGWNRCNPDLILHGRNYWVLRRSSLLSFCTDAIIMVVTCFTIHHLLARSFREHNRTSCAV